MSQETECAGKEAGKPTKPERMAKAKRKGHRTVGQTDNGGKEEETACIRWTLKIAMEAKNGEPEEERDGEDNFVPEEDEP